MACRSSGHRAFIELLDRVLEVPQVDLVFITERKKSPVMWQESIVAASGCCGLHVQPKGREGLTSTPPKADQLEGRFAARQAFAMGA